MNANIRWNWETRDFDFYLRASAHKNSIDITNRTLKMMER